VESKHPYSIVYACYGVGMFYLVKGEFDQSVLVLTRGLKVCDEAEIPVQRPLIGSCLGAAYAFLGRFDEALNLLEGAVEHTESMRRLGGQALRMALLSEAYMLAGRAVEAEALARRGLEMSVQTKDKGSQASLLRVLGHIMASRDSLDAEQAAVTFNQALILAQELGMRPMQAHCHLGIGQVHLKAKNLVEARSEILQAANLYRRMSMSFWLLKAETWLNSLAVQR
jgi:tetratricopeptide (TPR) repeat protein